MVDFLADRDVVLGILPLGTANSFARGLGVPVSLERAIAVIAQARVADIDLAIIDEDHFANSAALGLAATVARATPHVLKKWLGTLAYLLIGAAKFLSHRPFRISVAEDGRRSEYQALQVLFANGRFHGGMVMARGASPESRSILVQIVTGKNRWNLLRSWWAVAMRRPPPSSIVEEIAVRDAIIETEPRQYLSIDGEVAARTPVRLRVAYEALLVLVPASFNDSD